MRRNGGAWRREAKVQHCGARKGNAMAVIDRVKARIVGYDETTGEAILRAPANFVKMAHQQQREVWCEYIDSRPLSDRQRRSCYAMIREISDWSGETPEEMKHILKLDFWQGELLEMADRMFSLSNAPMSVVAGFQSWLARFIVRNDVPTKVPMLDYVDDIENYTYACLINKKCVICGKKADLHHWESVGMGRNRETIIHEGMEVMPLCREHHTEAHSIGQNSFMERYHLAGGIQADRTICKIYGLNASKKPESK